MQRRVTTVKFDFVLGESQDFSMDATYTIRGVLSATTTRRAPESSQIITTLTYTDDAEPELLRMLNIESMDQLHNAQFHYSHLEDWT